MSRRGGPSHGKGSKSVKILVALALAIAGLWLFLIATTKGPGLVTESGEFPGGPTWKPKGAASLRQTDGKGATETGVPATDRRPATVPGAAASASSQKAVIQSDPNNADVEDEEMFQVIFSTDCKPFQDWQSILVFLTAEMVGHKGPITRIASGCTPEEQAERERIYERLGRGGGQFRLHVTPDFSLDQASGKRFVYYNKPGGLQHWLNSPDAPPDGSVIALIDPDFVFMKPLTAKVRSEDVLFNPPVKEADLIDEVTEGHPVAQMYGIGDGWLRFNLSYIVGADSPALAVRSDPAWKHYSIGPPYIVHKADLSKIAHLWHKIVPKVFEGHPHLLAEMYAYSVASAHLQLPHLRLDNYMTSDVTGYGEAWPFVDDIPDALLCSADLSSSKYKLPNFLHYCQRYSVPPLQFWKRDVDKDVFSCDTKPYELPSAAALEVLIANTSTSDPRKLRELKYHMFQHCQIKIKFNKAIERYKKMFC